MNNPINTINPMFSKSFNLHSGGNLVSFNELAQLETPQALGPRHHPYPFHVFVEQVIESMSYHGLIPTDQMYALDDNNLKFFGVIQLRHSSSDYAPIVGLRGSHNQTFPRGVALGSRVFVCSNMAFSGEQVFTTRQTTFIERRMPALIDRTIARIPVMIDHQTGQIETWKETRLEKQVAGSIITDILRNQIVPSSKAYELIKEFDKPSHEEHLNNGEHTAWTLFNAVTQVLKPDEKSSMNAFDTLRGRTLKLTKLMDAVTA